MGSYPFSTSLIYISAFFLKTLVFYGVFYKIVTKVNKKIVILRLLPKNLEQDSKRYLALKGCIAQYDKSHVFLNPITNWGEESQSNRKIVFA